MNRLGMFLCCVFLLTGYTFGQTNQSTVEQTGDFNETLIRQVGENHQADVDQGTMNSVVVLDFFGIPPIDGNSSYNITYINQEGDGGWNRAYSFQADASGSGAGENVIDIDQYGLSGVAGKSNEAYTGQNGKRNYIQVEQGNAVDGNAGNFGVALQYGRTNAATIQQFGDEGVAGMVTRGNENDGSINQKGLHNRGIIVQAGITRLNVEYMISTLQPDFTLPIEMSNSNSARIDQTNTGGYDSNNSGIVLQNGDSNFLDLDQFGELNEAGVWQSGYGHDATVDQYGAGNTADVTQQD